MLNFFYMYGVMWSVILALYQFGWSDLCIPLDAGVVFFIIFQMAVSIFLGVIFRKYFKFYKIDINPHKKKTTTVLLVLFFILNIIYERYIPLLSVLRGNSMYASSFAGIPILYVLVSGFAIMYAFYLMYLFICFKEKSILIEFLIILMWFVLLFQRQNIFVIASGSLWLLVASVDFKKISLKKKIILAVLVIIVAFVALYIFGIIGNVRYGMWDSRDASMISTLAKINNKWPSWLSKSYAWAYMYIVSPLANLQYNVTVGEQFNAGFADFINEILPNYITNKLGLDLNVGTKLIVSSFTASTAFAKMYRIMGYGGIYSFFLLEILLLVIEITYVKRLQKYFVPLCVGWGYFLLMNFFDNSMSYPITSFTIVYPLLLLFLSKVKNPFVKV